MILEGARRVGVDDQLRAVRRRISPELRRNHRDDEALRTLLRLGFSSSANFVDVGANKGSILEAMVASAPRGHHVAFEPLPELARRLRERYPHVDVHEAAVGNAPGESTFTRVLGQDSRSGFGVDTWVAGETENLTVTVKTLDGVLDESHPPVLIKIDVEGAELGVLQGARRTLESARPIIAFEHGGGPHTAAIHSLLAEELGYEVFDLYGLGPLTAGEYADLVGSGKRWNFIARP
jgi:FkbM family methyltransferase